jgi:DMSO/TMAO reductase YedYZ molybdopterin-dependent catalytic subunit
MSLRRRGLLAGLASLGALALAGCNNRLSLSPSFQDFLIGASGLSRRAQRLFQGRMGLAQEFAPADITPAFKGNGVTHPQAADYLALAQDDFKDYRLVIDGLVNRPVAMTLDQIRALPARTQITRHDCVEGWSCIGQWTGARLGPLLDAVGLKPNARYVVFHCFDEWVPTADGKDTIKYYESVDLYDAHHPQTILAYGMNGRALPVRHGAPIRLRIERQLGYKHAKYVRRIEVVDSLDHIGGGKGGYWEDQGYEWYAGI